MDRRVERTKQAILNAYVHLAKRMPPEKISIAALCREANVNRGTFFSMLHSPDEDHFSAYKERRPERAGVLIFPCGEEKENKRRVITPQEVG